MKKSGIALLAAVLLAVLSVPAMAELFSAVTPTPEPTATAAPQAEAVNITEDCTFKISSSGKKYTLMTDGKYTTKWESNKTKNPNVTITAPSDTPIYGLYICFATMPESYEIQVEQDGKWVTYKEGDTSYYHAYVSLPEGVKKVRLYVTQDTKFTLGINELYCLSEGALPSWVQVWEPTVENADILFFAAHPDDELLFFGGAIPTYALQQGRKVAIAYLTYSNTTRRSEILNALWSIGIRNYPIIGTFSDHYSKTLTEAYKYAGGKTKVQEFVTSVIRQTKPQVIVTHSSDGEYGHKQHMMLSEAVQDCFDLAAEEGSCYDSFMAYGTWQAKKLYLHEYTADGMTPITFDWSQPLSACDGLTGTQVAQKAYAYHITQRAAGFTLLDEGVSYKSTLYDNSTFGLARTVVGEDVRCDDFLENIYTATGSTEEVEATPTPTAAPTAEPAYLSRLPELNEKGFLDEGEFLIADDTNGLYIFINQTTKVVIERKYDATQPLTWFEAEIWSDVDAGEYLKTYFYDEEKKGKVRVDAAKNAIAHKSVFAMNTDYYTYRISSTRHTGIVIRNGEILYDDPYTKPTTLFPNLDTVAFFPDGRLEVAHSYENTAQTLLDAGAENVYSFGPYLIRDGAVNTDIYTGANLTSKNPRAAIGMVEPGHYVCIMCEGRLKRSGGVTMNQLALMMKSKGCTQAINLDGGQTCVMIFMGKQLNLIGKYDGKTSARETCDIMAIGTSEQVGNVTFE